MSRRARLEGAAATSGGRVVDMKIDTQNAAGGGLAGISGHNQSVSAERGTANGGTQPAGSRDRIQVSAFASRISQALESSAAQRSQRVDALAAAYRSGTYSVNPDAVSRKAVEFALTERFDG